MEAEKSKPKPRRLMPVDVVEGEVVEKIEKKKPEPVKGEDFLAALQEQVQGETEAAKLQREARVAAEVISPLPASTSEILMLPLDSLRESPTNPRQRFTGLEELAQSMRASGCLVPLIVRWVDRGPQDNYYEIVAGHRRARAAKLAGIEALPCDVRQFSNVQVVEAQAIENLQRSDLDVLEEAGSFDSLVKHGWSIEQIAKKTARSVSLVRSRLKLLTLAPEASAALRDGWLPHSIAVPLARIPHAKQAEAVKEFKAEYKSTGTVNARAAVEWLQKEFTRQLKSAPFDLKDEALDMKAGACATCPKNSANGQAGFEDLAGTGKVCTDVPCYARKAAASWERLAAGFKEEGLEVLSREEGAELFKFGQLGYDSKFIELSAVSNEDSKRRTWGELLEKLAEEKRPPVLVVPDVDLRAHHLIERKKAVEALAAGGAKWAVQKTKEKAKVSKDRVKEREHRAAVKLENMVLAGLANAIAAKLQRFESLRPVFHLVGSFIGLDVISDDVMEAHGWLAEELHESIEAGKDFELFCRIFLSVTLIDSPHRSDEKVFGPYVKRLAKHFDLDLEQIQEAKLAELEREKAKDTVKPKKAGAK